MYTKLKQAMQEKHISVNKLSFMSSITASDLYKVFKGKQPMYPKWKERIAEALNADVKDLFNEEAEGGNDGTI